MLNTTYTFILDYFVCDLSFCNPKDIEFTVENGRLYMLQCWNGKRTAKAAVKWEAVNFGLACV